MILEFMNHKVKNAFCKHGMKSVTYPEFFWGYRFD